MTGYATHPTHRLDSEEHRREMRRANGSISLTALNQRPQATREHRKRLYPQQLRTDDPRKQDNATNGSNPTREQYSTINGSIHNDSEPQRLRTDHPRCQDRKSTADCHDDRTPPPPPRPPKQKHNTHCITSQYTNKPTPSEACRPPVDAGPRTPSAPAPRRDDPSPASLLPITPLGWQRPRPSNSLASSGVETLPS